MTSAVMPPPSSSALLEQAAALYRVGRFHEAATLYRQVLVSEPNRAEVYAALGVVLFLQRDVDAALTALRRAYELEPENTDTLYKLGNMLLREGYSEDRITECFGFFLRFAELTFCKSLKSREALHRIQHDQEQMAYLRDNCQISDWKFHLAGGERIEGCTVNGTNVAKASREWNSSRPQIIVIDNLLSEEALANLRLFCWGSTIWRETHPEGYLTAKPEYGLACPLIAQIDEDMRAIYPEILGKHLLRYLWAFKYDSHLNGVGTHADPSLVTFNFWITPDEANLEPEHGGLKVWNVAVPREWSSQRYIGDTAGCQAYLAQMNAKSMTIPYRSNRAVVFSSDLLHETDHMHFRDGYTNRRINITMLYGQRS